LTNLKGTNSIAYTNTIRWRWPRLTKIAKDVPAFQFRSGSWKAESSRRGNSAVGELRRRRTDQQIMFLLNAPAQRIATH